MVSDDHGSALQAWTAAGQPATPTKAQIAEFVTASQLPPPDVRPIRSGGVPPHGLAVVELSTSKYTGRAQDT